MYYGDFVKKLAAATEMKTAPTRKFLATLAAVLGSFEPGEFARTPLGTFRACARKAREITPPGSDMKVPVTPKTIVRLSPGHNLRRARPA